MLKWESLCLHCTLACTSSTNGRVMTSLVCPLSNDNDFVGKVIKKEMKALYQMMKKQVYWKEIVILGKTLLMIN